MKGRIKAKCPKCGFLAYERVGKDLCWYVTCQKESCPVKDWYVASPYR